MENKPYLFELPDVGEVVWKSDSSGLNIVAPILGGMIERIESI